MSKDQKPMHCVDAAFAVEVSDGSLIHGEVSGDGEAIRDLA